MKITVLVMLLALTMASAGHESNTEVELKDPSFPFLCASSYLLVIYWIRSIVSTWICGDMPPLITNL